MTGYVSYDRGTHLPREAVEMPNGPELQHSVDADLRKEMQENTVSVEGRLRLSCDGSKPSNSGKEIEGAGKVAGGSEKIHGMISDARRESRSGNKREDLNEMEGILKKYDTTQAAFGKLTQETLTETGRLQNRAHHQSQKLSRRQASPPVLNGPRQLPFPKLPRASL